MVQLYLLRGFRRDMGGKKNLMGGVEKKMHFCEISQLLFIFQAVDTKMAYRCYPWPIIDYYFHVGL